MVAGIWSAQFYVPENVCLLYLIQWVSVECKVEKLSQFPLMFGDRLFMNMSVTVRYVFRCLCESQCKNSKNTLTYQEVILICNCMVCGEGMWKEEKM